MTLPVNPDVDTILASCIDTLRDVVVPEVDSEWARYSGDLLIGSLEYARSILREDRNSERRESLTRAIEELRPEVSASGEAEWLAALEETSAFAAASKLLVAAQNHPGPLADHVREVLHSLLHEQLNAELGHSWPLFIAFARNMQGAQ